MELYVLDACPNCQKVKDALPGLGYTPGSDINIVDAAQGDNRNKIMELGGKNQVPFLVDGDTHLYESDAIIEYLRNKKQGSDSNNDKERDV